MRNSHVPRPKGPNDAVTSLNCPADWLDQAQEVADSMSRETGVSVSRADVLRLAVKRGLDVMMAERAKAKKK
jgi:hypothetical protein